MAAEVALVTGGAKRIGRAICLTLAQAGYGVAIHCNQSRTEAEALAGEIVSNGGKAAVVSADLADFSAPTLIVDSEAALGAVTLLVNNASLFGEDTFATLDAGSLDQHLDINLKAPILLAQAFARALPADREGAIVNLLDQRVVHPGPDYFSYTVAKTALRDATLTMALALAPRIRVNGVGPGPVLPNIHDGEKGIALEVERLPLGRRVTPEEIAAAVLYLASARSVTGEMIAVDGGQHLL